MNTSFSNAFAAFQRMTDPTKRSCFDCLQGDDSLEHQFCRKDLSLYMTWKKLQYEYQPEERANDFSRLRWPALENTAAGNAMKKIKELMRLRVLMHNNYQDMKLAYRAGDEHRGNALRSVDATLKQKQDIVYDELLRETQ